MEHPHFACEPSLNWLSPPMPLPDLPRVEALPDALLPRSCREWILDATDRLQVPPEMVAVPAIVTAGALVGRAVGVRPKRRDDWLVVPNLWGMIIGPPGILKSPALKEGARHLSRLAARASQAHIETERTAMVERTVIEARIKEAEQRARRGKTDLDGVRADLARLHVELSAAQPCERRYVTQDPTVEKLGELLRSNPRGILVMRDELAGWLRGLERPGREGDREFYLESWNGTGSYTYDRIGRGTVHVPALTVSILGTTQPTKLTRLLVDHAGGGGCDDGLLQRFGLAVWPDIPASWRNVDEWPDSAARERAWETYERLADEALATQVRAVGQDGEIPALPLAPDALELLNEYRTDLERRLRSGELAPWPGFAAHLAKYRSLVPSIALISHLMDVVGGQCAAEAVSLDAMRTAAAWADYLEAHARRIYGVDLEPGRAAGRVLAARIVCGDIRDRDSIRAVHQSGWSGLTDLEVLREGLDYLQQLNWLMIENRETGGRPSAVIRLHPAIIEQRASQEAA